VQRPEPTRVWLVREGDPNAIEGILSIDASSLTFVPQAGGTGKMVIPIAEIRGVRRRRGTPILTLVAPGEEGLRKLFAYFVKPPPLPGERTSAPKRMIRGPRTLERSAAAMTLRAANGLLKRDIDAWVRALGEAGAGG
jgi:hypothetical protein